MTGSGALRRILCNRRSTQEPFRFALRKDLLSISALLSRTLRGLYEASRFTGNSEVNLRAEAKGAVL
jgi:hypothetical protein